MKLLCRCEDVLKRKEVAWIWKVELGYYQLFKKSVRFNGYAGSWLHVNDGSQLICTANSDHLIGTLVLHTSSTKAPLWKSNAFVANLRAF